MKLTNETKHRLTGFLEAPELSLDFYGWVISSTEDDALPDGEREELGILRLLLLEADEGLRPLNDARECAAALLSERTMTLVTVGDPEGSREPTTRSNNTFAEVIMI